MKRALLLAAVMAGCAGAAVIRGTVVENLTGKALARAVVVLQPIGGTPGETHSMRTTQFGGFEFDGLAGGAYVLKAFRRGFLPMEYGQKRWNSAGLPLTIAENETSFLNLRLLRYGSIGGTLYDENDIGLPDHDVVAYRNTKPPQLAAETTTDDRGVYRIAGLEPDTYLVRTVGKHYDEGSYVPTFAKEVEKVENGLTYEVYPDQQTNHADVRPIAGQVFSLVVSVIGVPPEGPIILTLATEMQRKTVKTSYFVFTGLPKGEYELYAESPCDPSSGCTIQAAHTRVSVTRDMKFSLQLTPIQPVAVTVAGGPRNDPGQIWIRRKDLTGTGPTEKLEVTNGYATLLPGTWEAKLDPPAGYYVSGFFGPSFVRTSRTRVDGWNEYTSNRYTGLRFTVTAATSAIHGTVKSGSNPAAGAPVYLEAWDTVAKVRVGELRVMRTDTRGQFAFTALGPGTYRILSTFEYAAPDSATMESAGAASVLVAAKEDVSKDIDLWVIP
jgi:hypothetical protein